MYSNASNDADQVLKDENDKLNKRLLLLRDEYVKLQCKYTDLQTRYDRLASTSLLNGNIVKQQTSNSSDTISQDSNSVTSVSIENDYSVSFVTKILDFISSLFNNSAYSDLNILFKNGGQLFAHKFILQIRSQQWGVSDLNLVSSLSFPDLEEQIALPLFQWIYTGNITSLHEKSDHFILGSYRLF